MNAENVKIGSNLSNLPAKKKVNFVAPSVKPINPGGFYPFLVPLPVNPLLRAVVPEALHELLKRDRLSHQ